MATEAKMQIEVNYMKNGDIAIRDAEGQVFVIRRELRALDQRHDRLKASGSKGKGEGKAIADEKREKKAELKAAIANVDAVRQELLAHESETVAEAQREAARKNQELSSAGVGAAAGQKPAEETKPADDSFSKTNTNHSANNLKGLELNPKEIRLGDTLSGFSPTLDAAKMGEKFRELLKGMKNVESPELLQKQAETVIRQELQAKYDAMMKDYADLTPEAKREMDEWRDTMERQAQELARDFQNALRTKMEGGRMDAKWGNPEYMDAAMGKFVKEMSLELKNGLVKAADRREKEEKIKE